jgi:hypothetical protein
VEVDSPKDFEVVNSSELPTILRLPTLNLQNPAFSLDVLRVSLACNVFLNHPQNLFGFVGEVAVHLLLRLEINKIYRNEKVKTNIRKLGLDKLD